MAVIAWDLYTAETENIETGVLASLGIMREQFKGHLETPKTSQHICYRGVMPRDASRRKFFQSDI